MLEVVKGHPHDFKLRVQMGLVPGVSIMFAFGERESMDTNADGEDIWRVNELASAPTSIYVTPTPSASGEAMEVVSENAADAAAGTGIQSVRIHYLDANGDEQEEDKTLNGVTPVALTATDVRFIQRWHALTVGTGGNAAGHIRIHKVSDNGLCYSMIAAGSNNALVPIRMVPKGKTLYLQEWHSEEAQVRRVGLRLRTTSHGGVILTGIFTTEAVTYLKGTTSGAVYLSSSTPELSIVKVTGYPDAIGGEVSTGWWGYLVTN